jgi:hypothetical protein
MANHSEKRRFSFQDLLHGYPTIESIELYPKATKSMLAYVAGGGN